MRGYEQSLNEQRMEVEASRMQVREDRMHNSHMGSERLYSASLEKVGAYNFCFQINVKLVLNVYGLSMYLCQPMYILFRFSR